MKLLYIKYNDKYCTVLPIEIINGKMNCLKIHDGRLLIDDKAVYRLRLLSPVYEKLPIGEKINILKLIIPYMNKIYRTYIMKRCDVIKTFQVKSPI